MDKQDKAIIEAFRVLFKDFSQQLITYLTAENGDQKGLKLKILRFISLNKKKVIDTFNKNRQRAEQILENVGFKKDEITELLDELSRLINEIPEAAKVKISKMLGGKHGKKKNK